MNPPGISITSKTPLWRTAGQAWHLTQQVHKYQHTLEAFGGYWSAQFTIRGNRHLADDWLQQGLGRDILVSDNSLTTIWEGFVDKVTVNYGPLSISRGPLMDTCNSVNMVYCPIEYDEDDNPIIGCRTRTPYYTNNASVALWGTIPKTLTTSNMTFAETQDLRYTYLINHMQPRTSKEWRSDASGETSVTVDCLGYVHWLNWAYNDTGTAGEIDADAKIALVLADTPNSTWLTYNTDHVDSNTLQVPGYENDDNLAINVIKDVVARGDTSYDRWLFGVYAKQEAYYNAIPDFIEYQQRLSQARPKIENVASDNVFEVYPWQVQPGRWIMFPDFLIGQAAEYTLQEDPRAMFIETVKYVAPWTLELRGSQADTVDSLLAQKGISGITG